MPSHDWETLYCTAMGGEWQCRICGTRTNNAFLMDCYPICYGPRDTTTIPDEPGFTGGVRAALAMDWNVEPPVARRLSWFERIYGWCVRREARLLKPSVRATRDEMRDILSHIGTIGLAKLIQNDMDIVELRLACGIPWFDKYYPGLTQRIHSH